MPWASLHVKAYVAAQLLWDPDRSVEDEIRDYCATYYGPAGLELAQWFIAVETLDSYQQNSSFEGDENNDEIPDGWRTTGELLPDGLLFDPTATVLDRTAAASGTGSVKLDKQPGSDRTAGIAQRVDAEPDETWLATVRYRGRMDAGNVFLRLVALDADGTTIGHVAATHGHGDTGASWFRLRAKMKMPPETKRLEVQFAWDGSGDASAAEAHGTVRIDDLECGKVPEN